jgi:hypothetical protein
MKTRRIITQAIILSLLAFTFAPGTSNVRAEDPPPLS